MVKYSNGRAASLLDSAGPGTCRPAVSRSRPSAHHVDEADKGLLIRVPLCEGPFELRVPTARVKARHRRRHIEGMNPDGTPC
jgi:hypothetical protein